jgi:hypothetical protein
VDRGEGDGALSRGWPSGARIAAASFPGESQQIAAIARALVTNRGCCCSTSRWKALAPLIVQELSAVLRALVAEGGWRVVLVEQHAEAAARAGAPGTRDGARGIVHAGPRPRWPPIPRGSRASSRALGAKARRPRSSGERLRAAREPTTLLELGELQRRPNSSSASSRWSIEVIHQEKCSCAPGTRCEAGGSTGSSSRASPA